MNQPENFTLGVVVVTHDSARWLPGFFGSWHASLQNAPALEAAGVHLVLADSGSTDDALDHATQIAPSAHILRCGNVGYGAAANRGAALLDTFGHPQWLLICNPDLTFPPNFASALQNVIAQEKTAGCIGPQLLNPDATPQPSAGNFPSLAGLIADRFRPRQLRKYRRRQPRGRTMVDWVSGACLLIPRHAFAAVGGFDEHFFLYVEEVDLQCRLKNAGLSTIFQPALQLTHHAPNALGAVRSAVQRWAALGLLRYFAKHKNWLALRAYGMLALLAGRISLRNALGSRRRILSRRTSD